ncbi:MAG: chemotaxis protein CheA [Clostridia bacterium]|nr:chemotaxis protein CheA [Clostridia bacterium]
MTGMDMSQYLDLFLEEAEEQLQELDEGLIMLEQDKQNVDLLNRIFRAAHTIKGSSASMGFNKIAELTHWMESVLDRFRDGDLEVTQEVIDILLECLDTLEILKNEITTGEDSCDISGLMDRLKSLREGAPTSEGTEAITDERETVSEIYEAEMDELFFSDTEKNVLRAAVTQGYKSYHIIVDLDPDCLMKSVRAYIVFNNLKDLGEVIKTIPTTEEIEEEKFEQRFELVMVSKESLDKIKGVIRSINEIKEVFIREHPKAETLRSYNLEKPLSKKELDSTKDRLRDVKIEKKRVSQTVRVDVSRLDNLMNLMGELVIERTRLEAVGGNIKSTLGAGDLSDSLDEISVHIARLSGELQEEIMQARMFPIDQVFNRFPRMVRDLSRKSNKEIIFTIDGRETELDRTVIEEIGDPLIHLIRNAIDHGIESPEERRKLGKPEKGTVRLNAFHQENQIVITVEDDGRGMDPDKIKEVSVKKGIITESAAEKIMDQDAMNLIFAPGFSTTQTVSDVSGRGVGMDIVKSHIERINGLIDIDTEIGGGTKFTIRLPLTLAINRALLIKHGGHVFAFPLGNVVEIIEVDMDEVQYMKQHKVALVRGSFLPLYELETLLDLNYENNGAKKLPVVMVGISEKRIGIVVDELVGEQEIVIKSLGKYIGDIAGLAGATIMGDGSVALILDVRGLITTSGVGD